MNVCGPLLVGALGGAKNIYEIYELAQLMTKQLETYFKLISMVNFVRNKQ